MSAQIHLIVLWEFACCEYERIEKDMRTKVDVLYAGMASWPSDSVDCFGRFYGANLGDAKGKVKYCGGGPFRYYIVRDNNPRMGYRETSRGLELVNENLFDLKILYRNWTGGGHKVHTTNSPAEAHRDVYLLTGHLPDEFADCNQVTQINVLAGQDGWVSLNQVFAFLNQLVPYVALGEKEILSFCNQQVAELLGARRAIACADEADYDIRVNGRSIHIKIHAVGDDDYDRAWQEQMISRRVLEDGVYRLHPEDAFHKFVHDALYRQPELGETDSERASKLGKVIGYTWECFSNALLFHEQFLEQRAYLKTIPKSTATYLNKNLFNWRLRAKEIEATSGARDVRPVYLEQVHASAPTKTFFYTGIFAGKKCFIKYSPVAPTLSGAEYKYPQMFKDSPEACLFEKSYFWHKTSDGGAYAITEWIDGVSLEKLILTNDKILFEKSDEIIDDLCRIVHALASKKIVHRDVRPANLIVNEKDGRLKLIDFQFAAPWGKSHEDAYFSCHPKMLLRLGSCYAWGTGCWNDASSALKILMQFPESKARGDAMEQLRSMSKQPTKVLLCTRKMKRKLRHRYWKLMRKNIAALFSREKRSIFERDYRKELDSLKLILSI